MTRELTWSHFYAALEAETSACKIVLMRVVAVADTHLFHDDLHIPDGDVFIHAGDLCRAGDLDELATASQWLATLPHPTKVVVAGNHDWSFVHDPVTAQRILGPSVIYLQDSGVVLDGVRFRGSPWQPAFNNWAFNLPRGAMLREKWSLIPADTDVLITHCPPNGIGDGSLSAAGSEEKVIPGAGQASFACPSLPTETSYGGAQRLGCEELRARVLDLQAMLHLFGHIHDSGGAWSVGKTVYANVTTWECERGPTLIDIDLRRRQVTLVEVPPARL